MSQNTDESVTTWSEWEVNDNLTHGFNHSRSLYLTESGEVLLSELANRYINHCHRYIVSAYSLTDEVFNASSIENRQSGPERARIDKYFDRVCVWQGDMVDFIPLYLQITFPTVYHVVGIYIAQRCDMAMGLHYATLINVTSPVDGSTWEEVLGLEDISIRYSLYDGQGFLSVRFNRAYTMRYRRLHVLDSRGQRGAQCGLIGYP